MSLIDSTFAAIPAPLLADWGEPVTYLKKSPNSTYDPTTGTVLGYDTEVSLKAIITRLTPREAEGLYQTTDLKMIIGTAELGTYYPTETDRIRYTENSTTREGKIIAITTYRGTNPVLHTLIVRPQ